MSTSWPRYWRRIASLRYEMASRQRDPAWSGILDRAWERYEHRDDWRQIGPGLFVGKPGANPLRLPSPGDTYLTKGGVRVLVCPPNDLVIR